MRDRKQFPAWLFQSGDLFISALAAECIAYAAWPYRAAIVATVLEFLVFPTAVVGAVALLQYGALDVMESACLKLMQACTARRARREERRRVRETAWSALAR